MHHAFHILKKPFRTINSDSFPSKSSPLLIDLTKKPSTISLADFYWNKRFSLLKKRL